MAKEQIKRKRTHDLNSNCEEKGEIKNRTFLCGNH